MREMGVHMNQASAQALLMRYSRTTDIIVGTPLANRTASELEGLIGYFVNTVALRTDLSGACPASAGCCPQPYTPDTHRGNMTGMRLSEYGCYLLPSQLASHGV